MGAGLVLIAVGVWLMMKKSKIEAEIYNERNYCWINKV